MAFMIQCNNKGCYEMQEPYLDPATNKVYCSMCNKEMINVTDFTKRQMKSDKQFCKNKKDAFSVKCDKCGRSGQPKVNKDDLICCFCDKKIESLSSTFKTMLIEKLNNKKDV